MTLGIKFGLAVSFDQQLNLKEAPIVFMVMVADEISMGGASWAVSGPNMINFAATRAQNAFYIIGGKSLNKSLHSEVAVDTIAIINKYSNEHPDLVDITLPIKLLCNLFLRIFRMLPYYC